MFKRLSKILRVPLPQLTKALEENKGDPLTPILVKTAVHEDQVATPARAPGRVPGRRDHEHLPARLRAQGARGAAARLRRRGLAGGAGAAREVEGPRHPRRREDRQDRRRGGLRRLPARHARAAQLRVDSLGQPLGPFETRRPAQPGYNIRLTLDVGLQRAAERALREGIDLAYQDDSLQRERRRDRRARPARRRRPRDGVEPDLQAVRLRRPGRPEEARAADRRQGREGAELPGINRAIAGVYPPGSTFKPLTALAAISDGLLSPYEYIQCTPYAEYGLDEQSSRTGTRTRTCR